MNSFNFLNFSIFPALPLSNLKFFPLLLFAFTTSVASDKFLLIFTMPFLRFLSTLLSPVLTAAIFHTITFLNSPSTLLLKLSTLLPAWSLILSNFLIFFHLLLISTGYPFTFSAKSVLSCSESLILIHLPIFLSSYYLLNVLAYDSLPALNSLFSFSLSLSLSLLTCFSFLWLFL